MKNDCSKLIATSHDLCDENQRVLVLNDEKHIVINSKKRVRFFYMIENIQNQCKSSTRTAQIKEVQMSISFSPLLI